MKFKGSFGDWLKQRRRALDLTQQELADQVGCAEVTIRKIEGDATRPSKQIAERMADVLAIAAEERAAFVSFARCLADKPPSLPVETASRLPAHNLPPQPTPFVGRTVELAQISERLADPTCRLLSLVGPGGIGKTRLALQAAQGQIGSFAHGIYFVPLASVSASDQIAPSIISALNLSFYSPEDPATQIVNYLREKHMLLILDNLEHLLDGFGLLTAILENATQIKLIATSRERLNVQEEWVLLTDGLSFPYVKHTDPLADYSAVQLFVQCARRIQPDFSLANNVSAVVAICQVVEGMPLGIELAASWLRVLPCDEIAKKIQRSFDFLATPLRNVPERHRSMRVMLDHSWKLLSDTEQHVLSKLSVFRGGFDLQAAEQVADASLSILGALIDKSMLKLSPTGRYDLHELLRQYAADKLADSGQTEVAEQRHFAYFLSQAEQAEAHLYGPEQEPWLDRLELNYGNLQAALSWSLRSGQAEAGLRMAVSMEFFWVFTSLHREAFDWLQKLLAIAADIPISMRARALRIMAISADNWGDIGKAKILCEESLALAYETHDEWNIAWALGTSGNYSSVDDSSQAVSLYEQALALFRKMKDEWGISHMLRRLGWALIDDGNYQQAAAVLEEALSLARQAKDVNATAWSLFLLGNVVWFQDRDSTRAMAAYQECLSFRRKIREIPFIVGVLFMKGEVARADGNYEGARRCYGECLILCQESQMPHWIAQVLMGFAGLALADGKPQDAARLFGVTDAVFPLDKDNDFLLFRRAAFVRDLAATRAQLGDTAFDVAWAEGRAMTISEAIAYALKNC